MEMREQLTKLKTSAEAHSFILRMINEGQKIEDIEAHCYKMLSATVEQLKILSERNSVE